MQLITRLDDQLLTKCIQMHTKSDGKIQQVRQQDADRPRPSQRCLSPHTETYNYSWAYLISSKCILALRLSDNKS